jgi:hypothetical protein
MQEQIDHLLSVEQFVLASLEKPGAAWRKYLGNYYNEPNSKELIDGWLMVYARQQQFLLAEKEPDWCDTVLAAPQIEQRTKEWYDQTLNVLTASEIWSIFKSNRERALLVMSKVPSDEPKRRNNQLCVPTEFMSAFDWGIRFEPVIKQIYEFIHSVTVKDVGRITHSTDKRVAASPDGIVIPAQHNSKKTYRLIEIKCPVSREIGEENIPPEYYAQMQTQMQVTGAMQCDYIEAKIRSGYKTGASYIEGPAIANGTIWRVTTSDDKEQYIYGPIHYKGIVDGAQQPSLDEYIVQEEIPWELIGWHEVTVARDDKWWENATVAINAFWDDVELARRGDFNVPESTRKKRAASPQKCMITLSQEDN